MSALIRAELRSRRRMLAGLSLGAFTLLLVVALAYHSVGLGAFGRAYGRRLPTGFQAFSGSRHGDLLSPHGWLAFGFNHPLFLVLTLTVAISIGTGAFAGEVDLGRSELIFVRPVGRGQFLAGALVVWLGAELIVIAGAWGGSLIGGLLSSDLRRSGLGPIGLAPLQYLPLALLVTTVALLASAASHSHGQAVGVAVGTAVIAYLTNLVSLMIGSLSWLHWLSPFGYYDPQGAIVDGPSWSDAGVLLVAATLLLAACRVILDRRDLA